MVSFREKGLVSIWAGKTKPDPTVDILKTLCGVEYYDVDKQAVFFEDDWTAKSLSHMLKEICYSNSFLDAAIAASKELKLRKCYYVVCQFDFKYDPQLVEGEVASDPIFLGAFPWSDSDA